ncbi:hypothetical protein CHLRE_08g376150v5 [Chlamydomonas reinhardtii]|uniref:Diphthamide biosynthesis protein 2 n=1 Tax=Chlamydomonas reinhardtii TaxID=3055 RepID=A0A2K3DHQ6_CHLRE|nr:uncharacterized protein CHLRE_08g376150v5 [Chlamydomonas reinhardtii]PNW80058.1 hypothetical protein CHLRE_08g376150v5 [Chlamydomonas reinhardtii]
MATPSGSLEQRYDIAETVDYILEGGFRDVALQFPDEQLADSPDVFALLQARLGDRARVFVLADTAYNPLGVDEVAAAHLAADCVVHYGRASLSPVNSLPAFFVFPKEQLDAAAAAAALQPAIAAAEAERRQAGATAGATAGAAAGATAGGFQAVVVLVDQGYHHRLGELRAALEGAAATAAAAPGAAADSGTNSSGGNGSDSPLPPFVYAHISARSLRPAATAAKAAARGCGSGAAAGAAAAGPEAAPGAAGGCGAPACCAAGSEAVAGATGFTRPEAAEGAGKEAAGEEVAAVAAAAPPSAAGGCVTCGRTDVPAGGCGAAASSSAPMDPATAAAGSSTSSSTPTATPAATAAATTSMVGLSWSLPAGAARADCLYVWVGPEGASSHQVLQMTHSGCEWLSYDPAAAAAAAAGGEAAGGGSGGGGGEVRRGVSEETRRLLKRRNFLVEKARAASIVGILVSTLATGGFLDVISALRRLCAAADKKSYTFLIGKPNPAKLGNFPEVDVFVMVADAQGLILDSRDYLAPLVTPWEAALALTGRHIEADDYRLELGDVLDFERQHAERTRQQEAGQALVSLGGLGLDLASRGGGAGGGGGRGEVVARNAAEYLVLKRSYKGLEMPATGAEPKAVELAVEGRSGRAAGYADEQPAERSAAAW